MITMRRAFARHQGRQASDFRRTCRHTRTPGEAGSTLGKFRLHRLMQPIEITTVVTVRQVVVMPAAGGATQNPNV